MRISKAILKRTIAHSLIPTGTKQTGKGKVSDTNGTDTSAIDPATAQAIANNAGRRIPSVTPSNRDFQI